ncbi:fimbrillin family protein [Pendulispora brunnea]|uniref:Fimbrillin family protein n=1 Tax=Pendulispora brunnea TaxID=2905690 RepID=A0ABZ2KCP3_9BACT
MQPIRGLLTCATLLLFACSQDNGPSPNPPPTDGDTTTFTEGDWHPGVALRRVGDAFQEEMDRIAVTAGGNVAAIRTSHRGQDDRVGTSVLELFDGHGRRLASAAAPATAIMLDIIVHPSGEFTVVEVRGDAATPRALWLRRLGADLHLIHEAPLRDQPTERDRQMYVFERQPDGSEAMKTEVIPVSGDGIVRPEAIALTRRRFVLAARGEEAILSTFVYGTKVYALAPDLRVLWSRQIMPLTSSTVSLVGQEVLTVDGAGRIGIAFPIDRAMFPAYQRHFDRNDVIWSGPRDQTMVTRISADGQSTVMRLFSHGDDAIVEPNVAGIVLHDEQVTLCGSARVEGKYQEPNRTMEWDLSWVRGNLEHGTVESGVIDLKRDDYAFDCKIDEAGGMLFAGSNDFFAYDTHSWMEPGQGFVYGIDATGHETTRLAFRGPRHTEVRAIDQRFFAGTFDGPLTHTPSAEVDKKAMLGVWR